MLGERCFVHQRYVGATIRVVMLFFLYCSCMPGRSPAGDPWRKTFLFFVVNSWRNAGVDTWQQRACIQIFVSYIYIHIHICIYVYTRVYTCTCCI